MRKQIGGCRSSWSLPAKAVSRGNSWASHRVRFCARGGKRHLYKTSRVSPLAAVVFTIQVYAKVEVDTGLQFESVDGGSDVANLLNCQSVPSDLATGSLRDYIY